MEKSFHKFANAMLLERKILHEKRRKKKQNKTALFTISFKVIKEFKIKVNLVSAWPILF